METEELATRPVKLHTISEWADRELDAYRGLYNYESCLERYRSEFGDDASDFKLKIGLNLMLWGRTGKNTFDVCGGLGSALEHTDPNCAPGTVKHPYQRYLIKAPFEGKMRWVLVVTGEDYNLDCGLVLIDEINGEEITCYSFTLDNVDDGTFTPLIDYLESFALWLSTPGADKEPGRINKKQRRRMGKGGKEVPKLWIVGKNVKITKRGNNGCGDGQGRSFKVKHKYMVRGHFRNQPCGKGRRDRKTIWIEPHVKGPDMAASWAHVYQ